MTTPFSLRTTATRLSLVRAPRAWLGGLVLLALAVRLVVVLTTHFSPLEDSAAYDHDALQLATAGSFPGSQETLHAGATAFYPPAFPLLLAGLDKLVGLSPHVRWEAGRVLEAVLGAVVVWLIGLIGARLWSWRVGLLAAAIAAVYPPLVLIGSSLLSEALFIPLALGAVWAALVHRERPRLRWALLAGILIGLAALTRGNGVLLVIPVAWLAKSAGANSAGRRRSWEALRAPAIVVGVMLVLLVPWTVRNLSVFHRFVPIATETGYTLAGTFNGPVQHEQRFPAMWVMPQARAQQLYAADPRATEASVSGALTSQALHYIRAHPGSLLRTAYWNTVRLLDLTPSVERAFAPFERYPTWLAMLSVYTFWALAPLAIIGVAIGRPRAAPAAFWACPAMLYLSTVLVLGLTRGRSPIDPFLVLLAALGVVGAWDRWHPPGRTAVSS